MKILHVCSIENDMASGVSVIVPQYARNQAKVHDVVLYNVNDQRCSGLESVIVYNKDTRIEEILSKYGFEIAVFHGIYFKPYIHIYKKVRERNIPYIVIPHGSLRAEAQSQKKLAKIIVNGLFFRSFVKHAAEVQYLSKAEQEASSGFKHNSFIMPNGVPEVEERCNVHQREGLSLVFIGRYSIFYKGLDILFDACEKIQDFMRENHIVLNLYGVDFENNLMDMQEMVARKKLADIVSINGPVFEEEKRRVLLDADYFIQTSRSEGQPVGILEALSYGLPVIVTSGTSFSEMVVEHACGFDAGSDCESVAEAILNAFSKKGDLQIMSINAKRLIREKYSWEKIVEGTMEVYKRIADIRRDEV